MVLISKQENQSSFIDPQGLTKFCRFHPSLHVWFHLFLFSTSHFAPATLTSLLFFEQIRYTHASRPLCLQILCLEHCTPDISMNLLHSLQAPLKYHMISICLFSKSLSIFSPLSQDSLYPFPSLFLPLCLCLPNIINISFNIY